ncbi:MAG: hypothetical protein ACYSUV_02110 [Planctomycetota bacterium]|jgi:hypothetical protein
MSRSKLDTEKKEVVAENDQALMDETRRRLERNLEARRKEAVAKAKPKVNAIRSAGDFFCYLWDTRKNPVIEITPKEAEFLRRKSFRSLLHRIAWYLTRGHKPFPGNAGFGSSSGVFTPTKEQEKTAEHYLDLNRKFHTGEKPAKPKKVKKPTLRLNRTKAKPKKSTPRKPTSVKKAKGTKNVKRTARKRT